MKKNSEIPLEIKFQMHGSLKSYVIGFILSIALTLIAFWLVSERILPAFELILTISLLALAQLLIQLLCFLHLGADSKPYWNVVSFFSMFIVMLILVFGSLWIMYNLNYYMMVPS